MKKSIKMVLVSAMILSGCAGNVSLEPVDVDEAHIGVIQLMQHPALDASYQGFRDVLIEAGVKEENIDYQVAGEQANCATVADKLVNGGNHLIYAIATPALQAAAAATLDIPIVGSAVTDYESTGLIQSDKQPGGNVTGVSDLTPIAHQFDLLKQLLPETHTVGIMYCSSEDNSIYQASIAKKEAARLGMSTKTYTVADSNDIQSVTTKACNDDIDALYIPTDNLLATYMSSVSAITNEHKLPVVVGEEGLCRQGGIATVAFNYEDLGRLAGEQALAILKGERRVSEMPIKRLSADQCRLIINKKAARACDIEIDETSFKDALIIE